MEHRIRTALGAIGAQLWTVLEITPSEGDSFAISLKSPREASAFVTVHAGWSDEQLRNHLLAELRDHDPV